MEAIAKNAHIHVYTHVFMNVHAHVYTQVTDMEAVVKTAHAAACPVICDDTFTTPWMMKPMVTIRFRRASLAPA